MKRAVVCCVLSWTALAVAQTGTRPRNIFDDDWEPPKRPAAVRPEEPRKVTPKPPDTTPATTVTPTVTTPEVVPTRSTRRPIPKPDDQAAVRKVMRELYADQLKDTTPAGRQKLTRALLQQADKLASEAPTDQFVLLTAAVDASVAASNLSSAFSAADRLARTFEIDGLDVKADAITRFKSTVPGDAAQNVIAALALSSELEAADDPTTALRVCTAVQPVAAANPDLRNQVVARMRELNVAKDLAERIARDREKLKESPDDPAANLAVGRYECFTRGQWRSGLPHLARGSDPALKQAAQAELDAAESTQPATLVRVADLWWDLANKQPEARSRTAVISHALGFYQKSLNGVTGLQKTLVEKRIAQAKSALIAASGRIDLLALFDPAKDVVKGQWESTPDGLMSDRGNESRVAFPYQPPGEYDLIIEFTRLEGTEYMMALFTWSGNNGACVIKSSLCGFSLIDKHRVGADNPTIRNLDRIITTRQRHRLVLEVRRQGVRALMDNVELTSFVGRPDQLSQDGNWAIRKGLLGIAKVGDGRFVYHSAELRPVTGTGKPLRAPANRSN